MDPIHPIVPGPPGIPRGATPPVQRLPPVSRERDRPDPDEQRRRREEARRRAAAADGSTQGEQDGHGHVDVRA